MAPDLLTVSKALANGWPLALVSGARRVMNGAAGMHFSATFHGDTMAMAACLETQRIAEREHTREHVEALGQRLIDGLNALCAELNVSARAYGEPLPAMPFFRFDGPEEQLLSRLFYREVLARGVLLHPRHLWFLSGAHTEQDVDFTLAVCRDSLAASLRLSNEG
jgi:glutamate-1-semialdehyde aminotransferase